MQDASDPKSRDRYDLVTVFEAIHDMARPVDALMAIREMLAPGGTVVIADERTAESFCGAARRPRALVLRVECAVLSATGREDQPSAATGT